MHTYILHALFIGNTLISNARLSLAKSQAKAKHPETVVIQIIIRFLHPRYYPKIKQERLASV